MPFLTSSYGNPSATYSLARQASKAVDDARGTVASVLNARPSDIVFTSGGTESINIALKGVAFAQKKARAGNHIVTTTIEHHAVHHSCNYLEQFGFDVTYVEVDRDGIVDPDAVARAVTDRTVLVSVMLANNEVGTIEPLSGVARAVAERCARCGGASPCIRTPCRRLAGLPLISTIPRVDLLTSPPDNFGGPKGTGPSICDAARRSSARWPAAARSGSGAPAPRRAPDRRSSRRAGSRQRKNETPSRFLPRLFEERLTAGVLESVPDSRLNGHAEQRLPNNVNISFRGVRGDELVLALDRAGIAASAGAACGSSTWEPSHVLLAMGLSMPEAVGALRLTLGPETTSAEIDSVISRLPAVVAGLRDAVAAAGLPAPHSPIPISSPG